jgi:tetratricopeptide (TPR) repeat protein
MTRWFGLLVLTGLPLAAWGAPDEDEPASTEDTITGVVIPPLAREPRSAELAAPLPATLTYEEYRDRPLPPEAYIGAKMLTLEPEFVDGVQKGLELLFLRKYEPAREHFATLEQTFPGTGVRSVVDVLVWQALMLENFDYRYDKQYWTSSKQARRDLDAAMDIAGNEGWENLMYAAIVGIESIHTVRQGNYLSALSLAFQAMEAIERCRAAAPDFVDLKLADGMYNYWRSVITLSSKMLPDFGDHRVEGIEQMELVERTGVFVGPLATLSLAFTWMEQNDLKRAATSCGVNRSSYPDNVVNNLVCGMVYINMRRFSEAIEVFDRILAVDPTNTRVHYFKGLAWLKQGELESAKAEFVGYLAAEHLEAYQRSYTNYRLGQLYTRQQDYPKAVEHYETAVKIDGNKAAKSAIDRLQDRKKEGKISW